MRYLMLLSLIFSTKSFAGGSFGGTPPSIKRVSPQLFHSIAIDALSNQGMSFSLENETLIPKSIDLQSRTIRMETLDKRLIDLKDEDQADSFEEARSVEK